ncbi:cupin domain-containing protein [Spirosoma sp. BT702]|uniref:Cupin domain-containing protein n=1 Tax=Spirosoma profusum TaxID=2771354 RepID=A0A927AVV5_9BACT|nr:cupin domain-containing protein [Spirosoma profusum]MBD2705359.1 cupin domain-containing protein [Spirosoma profusum]
MKRRHFLQNSILAPVMLSTPTNDSAERPAKGITIKDGKARNNEQIVVAGTPVDFKLISTDTDGDLAIMISSNNRKGSGPPVHVHQKFDEFFCVLEGEFLFQVGDEQTRLKPGDTMFVPRKVNHGFDCVSSQPGKLLVTIQPASNMEEFFRQIGQVFAKPGPPDLEAIQKIYQSHDSAIVGPPVTTK